MMTTRRGMLAGAAALGAAGLAACSGGSGGGGDLPDELDTSVEAEISFAIWDIAQRGAMEQIIEAFNKEYPGVTVNIAVTQFTDYFTKLQTQASGGDLPDVFFMNGPNFQLYASEGLLQDVSELPGFDPSNYPESMNGLYTLDDVQYAVPKDFDTIGLWYNKTLLEKAGVPEPDGSWTWDDFRGHLETCKEKLGDGIWPLAGVNANQATVYPLIFQCGGEVISEDGTTSGYDSEASIKTFTFLSELIADGLSPDTGYQSENRSGDVFGAGKAAFFLSGNWSAAVMLEAAVKDEVSAGPLPYSDEQANVIHGIGYAMSAKSKNKDAAAAFLSFLGTKEANIIQAEAGAANPAFIGTNQAYVDSAPEYNLQMFIDAAETAHPYPVSKNTSAWLSSEETWYPQILDGAVPVAEGCASLAEEMNKALADEQ